MTFHFVNNATLERCLLLNTKCSTYLKVTLLTVLAYQYENFLTRGLWQLMYSGCSEQEDFIYVKKFQAS